MASFQKYETNKGIKWSYIVELGKDPTTGKRTRKKGRGFKTKKEAQHAAATVEQQITTGTFINEMEITFKDFSNEWLDLYMKNTKPSSIRGRKPALKHLLELFSYMKMKEITPLMYQNALIKLHEKGYSHNYMVSIHTTGKLVFSKAVELKVIQKSPTEYAKLPKKNITVEELENQKKEIKYLEKDELANFLSIAKSSEQYFEHLFFTLLAFSGMRIGEQMALKWSDIDFDTNTISITKTLYVPNGVKTYQVLTPKTSGSVREIRIDSDVILLLKRHRAKQSELKIFMGRQYHNGNLVFSGPSGYPLPATRYTRSLKRLIKNTGITKPITLHSFRHTHTSLLIEAEVGIKEIQQRLGHTNISTTMNIYAHMTKDMEEKASQRFSNLMKGLV